ncbi:tyrosine-type recombinase/integrase [Pseudomonas aeruginosa]|nr:tyrosine-type recombinase/integrase [Pseudomonas aeruginosa]
MTTPTFAVDAFENWLRTSFASPYSSKTIRVYCAVVSGFQRHIDSRTEEAFPYRLDDDCVIAFLRAPGIDGRPYSRAYQVLRHSALVALFHWLVETRVVSDSPMERLPRHAGRRPGTPAGGNRPKRLPPVLMWRDQRHLLQVIDSSHGPAKVRDSAIVSLGLATGLRSEEICNATLGGLDLTYRRIRVVGKGNKERLIDFSHDDRALDPVHAWLKTRGEILRQHEVESDLLFISRAGRRLSGSLVYQQVSRHLQLAGLAGRLKRCGVHVLRHTAASVMFARGVPILQIKENLGHEDLSTTQIYAHLLPAEAEAL